MSTLGPASGWFTRARLTTAGIAAAGVAFLWAVVWREVSTDTTDPNWSVFAVIALLLLGCERLPTVTIRSAPIATVTPRWMFAYGLLLLGSPSLAVAIALLGTTWHAIAQSDSVPRMLERVAGASISLSAAGLVLSLLGVRGPITDFGSVPWDWALAIVAAGIAIVVCNAFLAAIVTSSVRQLRLPARFRRAFADRVTSEGALLSMAPIWVIGINFSLVLAPLLAITTILVFRSTRQALEQSHDAHHDPLTGLLNRRAFLDRLGEQLEDARHDERTTLLIMDLNGFKEINDQLGHQIGDSLLIAFSRRLDEERPDDSIAARLGGDEFALLTVGSTSDLAIAEAASALHDRLSEPLDVEGFPVTVGVSIGVGTAPDDGRTPRDLLRAADVAMYKAKRMGNSVERYGNCAGGPQRGRLNLLADLGEALENDVLHVHFQPQIRMADGTIDTVEALVRWNHPDHGPIPPSEFVGLAEQTDLIGPITEAVLRVATRSLLVTRSSARLAVNVSLRSLQDPYFAQQVFAILAEIAFPPERLEIEITERAIVSNIERISFTLERLRAAGVRIAIDDFGAGYSSYQTLRSIDVDRVKIDKDFVRGLLTHRRDRTIVASLIRLAHDLGLDVVAEGVETTTLWDELVDLGCDVAQGYGIAVPMPHEDLRDWMAVWADAISQQLAAQRS